jgi:hypothetical protein
MGDHFCEPRLDVSMSHAHEGGDYTDAEKVSSDGKRKASNTKVTLTARELTSAE